jgi:hypothetical protein
VKQMRSGAGAAVCLVEHMISKEKCVLKCSYIEENERSKFEEQMKFWGKLCSKSEEIVVLKEYFFNETNACLCYLLLLL